MPSRLVSACPVRSAGYKTVQKLVTTIIPSTVISRFYQICRALKLKRLIDYPRSLSPQKLGLHILLELDELKRLRSESHLVHNLLLLLTSTVVRWTLPRSIDLVCWLEYTDDDDDVRSYKVKGAWNPYKTNHYLLYHFVWWWVDDGRHRRRALVIFFGEGSILGVHTSELWDETRWMCLCIIDLIFVRLGQILSASKLTHLWANVIKRLER